MDIDSSDVRQLTRDNGLAMSPSWAPAGDKLIYTSYRSRKPELHTISPEGGGSKQITERQGLRGIGAKFSPDGGTIATAAAIAGVSKIALLNLSGSWRQRVATHLMSRLHFHLMAQNRFLFQPRRRTSNLCHVLSG